MKTGNFMKEIIKALIYLIIGAGIAIFFLKCPTIINYFKSSRSQPIITNQPAQIVNPQPVSSSTFYNSIKYSKPVVDISKAMTKITTNQPSALQQRITIEKKAISPLGIGLFQPTYILPAYYTTRPDNAVYKGNTPDNQRVEPLEFKAQLSLIVPIINGEIKQKPISLDFAYTQLSYWQFYAKSQWFRETDYEPELFTSLNFHPNWLINLGTVHQSNGQGGDMERSWNRAYANLIFSGPKWMISIQPWVLIFKSESSDLHNPNIAHYMGNGQVLFAYKFGRNEISIMARNELESGFKRGAEEVDWSVHMWKHFYLYTQFFSGYGQSLIEYNHFTNGLGVGIALNNWI